MVNYRLFAFISTATALPLNINLGAYSPALVVGDGEISFGGKQDVTALMNALEGAAVTAASNAISTNANNTPANAPVVESATADPALAQEAQQIAALQGISKEIAPRDDGRASKTKRDLAGFDRALQYAEAALTKGPDIQLGTGAEGSGVGIIVDNQPTAGGRTERRHPGDGNASQAEAGSPKLVRRARVTTMYVQRGVPAVFQGDPGEISTRETPLTERPSTPAAFSRRDAIDAVNLNVGGDKGLTMTFVETVNDG